MGREDSQVRQYTQRAIESSSLHLTPQQTPAVPKFSSFQPKPAPSANNEDSRNEHSSQSVEVLSASRHVSRSGSRHHARSSLEHRDRSRKHRHGERPEKEEKSRNENISPPKNYERDIDGSSTYLEDRVGDTKILTYGTLDRHAIPYYVRSGKGNVVGSVTGARIDRSQSSEKGLVLAYDQQLPFGRSGIVTRPKLLSHGLLRIRRSLVDTHQNGEDLNADFLPLSSSSKRRKLSHNRGTSPNSVDSDDGTTDYRSIESIAKAPPHPHDEDLSSVSEDPSDSEVQTSFLLDKASQLERAELSRKIDTNPGDTSAWLELIAQQNNVYQNELKSTESSSAQRQSNADIKVSMYEKALEKVPDLKGREQLQIGMMEEASKFQDARELSARWRALIDNNPSSFGLWTCYLNFSQTNSSTFKYEDIRADYMKVLQALRQAQSQMQPRSPEWTSICERQVYILLRLTFFMRDSGFTENAIAAWQAIFEFSFFKPNFLGNQTPSTPQEKELTLFEDFWESEVGRIGEEGARGWAAFAVESGEPLPPKADREWSTHDDKDAVEAWPDMELDQSDSSNHPARTTDDVAENDPFRVILFSDIRDMLFTVSVASNEESMLVSAFLAFCQHPLYPSATTNSLLTQWRRDPFLRNGPALATLNPCDPWHLSPSNEEETSILDFPVPNFQPSTDFFFHARDSGTNFFPSWSHAPFPGSCQGDVAWTRAVLKVLVQTGVGGDNLAEYFLALECQHSPETVKKTAKSLIRMQPSSLRLYNAYALVEYQLGNTSTAENVLLKAINMGNGLNESLQQDAIILWRTWVWKLLESGQTEMALRRLLTFTDKKIEPVVPNLEQQDSSQTAILRTQNVSVFSAKTWIHWLRIILTYV